MLQKSAGCLIVFLWAGVALAQSKVTVRFESAAPRTLWTSDDWPTSPPKDAVKSEGIETALASITASSKAILFALDDSTGNLAAKPLAALVKTSLGGVPDGVGQMTRATWTVSPKDFNRLYRVVVQVEHGGRPVASASVQVSDGERKQSQILSPSDKGTVAFFALKSGQAKVEVQYKSAGTTHTLPAQVFELSLKREKPEPTLAVVIPEDVSVVEPTGGQAAPPTAGQTKAPEDKGPAVSILGSVIVYVGGIALACAVGYGLLKLVQKHPKLVEDKLQKLGVQMPTPQDQDPLPAAPPPPEPIKPIILGDADPIPISPSPNSPNWNPRLVAENGDVVLIAEGSLSVGRDDGLPQSVADKSTISRKHAELVREGAEIRLRDLGSTNGTYVNGAKVETETKLRPGDALQFGAVRFRYEV